MNNSRIIFFLTIFFTINILAEDPNFELWNKTEETIEIRFYKPGERQVFALRFIEPKEKSTLKINPKNGILIQIDNGIDREETYEIASCHGDCRKTIYLSYDRTGLRPQKGTWHGLLGITDSGYNNKNNIKENQIIKR